MNEMSWIPLDDWRPHDRAPVVCAHRMPTDYPGVDFDHWDDDGLGPATGIALQLGSGRVVDLFWHEYSPVPGLEIYADAEDDPRAIFDEVSKTLSLTPDETFWISPRVEDAESE